ncbi:MAG TPA: hydantoinase/oxoprolinase family protein [Solirubrobacteraceae bacterium]|nr:hydantoinase/oxoprolinase family protein [Solirubrobacteraceae bacterium]
MIGVDVGGTFTDVVAVRDGRIEVTKVPSDANEPAGAVVEGARRLGVDGSAVFNHASTMGLNAVITRRLPKVAFLTTEGHRDILDRGTIRRPLDGQTDPAWRRPFGDAARPLVPRYLRRGVVERMLADGSELCALDEAQAREQLAVLRRCEVQGVAICLLNAYVNPAHELRLRELVREELGDDVAVSVSSETSPLAKEYARASTTVIDVFMKLIFGRYSAQLDAQLRELGFEGELNFADCAATLLPWQEALEKPFRIVFAGPAAGTISSTRLGEALGTGNLLCADVGGTSTDVSLVVDGAPFVNDTFEIEHDLVINALSTEVSSVGAGGGSIVSISPSGDVRVGPESAGSDPGPACYGRGGMAPTLTDACLLIGILDPDGFAGGEMRLDSDLARAAFERLDTPLSFEQRVAFAYRLAVANIAEEVTNVAVRHGVDPRDFTLVAYGAAGPMLLPAALDLLQVARIVIPPHPGLFSAMGLLSTDLVYYESRSSYVVLSPDTAEQVEQGYQEMERALRERVAAADGLVMRRSLDGRLLGQSWETPFVDVGDEPITASTMPALIDRFHEAYERRYGNRFPYVPVQGVTYRVQLVVPADKIEHAPRDGSGEAPPARTIELRYLDDEPLLAAEYERERLPVGTAVEGPAVIREALSTTFVMPGQVATIGRFGEIVIEELK